ncbi:MAG: hypothetical protein M3Y81_22655 [Chloroflexota bacterium]|nr:hypothetical protein [Chloroflexota bacterium]
MASIGSSTSGTSSPQWQVWNALTGKRLLTGGLETEVPPRLVVWSADGQHLLVFVCQYGSVPPGSRMVPMVQIWDAATGQQVRTIPVMQPVPLIQSGALSDQPRLVAWALNEEYLAVAKSRYDVARRRDDAVIEIWDIATGREVALLDPASSPLATRQSGSTSTLMSAPGNGTPTPSNTPAPTSTPAFSHVEVEKLVWAPESGKLAVCTLGQLPDRCQIWDTQAGKQLRAFPVVYQADTIIAWSPDGGR